MILKSEAGILKSEAGILDPEVERLQSESGIFKSAAFRQAAGEMPSESSAEKPHVSLLEFLSVEAPRRGQGNRSNGLNSGSGLGSDSGDGPLIPPGDVASPEAEAEAARLALDEDRHAQDRAVQTRAMVDAARAESRIATRRELERDLHEQVAVERQRIAVVCGEFMRDRQRYFADAEEQVVKLALAIAARVLHRESMMDPLLLAGAVRVAIAKVEETSAVSLRVRPEETALWQEVFPTAGEPKVDLLGDDRLAAGEVVLETVVGRVELGVAVQLEEIEQGFFDLLQRRPN